MNRQYPWAEKNANTSDINIKVKSKAKNHTKSLASSGAIVTDLKRKSLGTIVHVSQSNISASTRTCDCVIDGANKKNTNTSSSNSYVHLLDTASAYKIPCYKWDNLKENINSTLVPVLKAKLSIINKKESEPLPVKQSQQPSKGAQELYACSHMDQKPSVKHQHHSATAKKNSFFIPTPKEMVKMQKQVPLIFVHTSCTGRKTVKVPIDLYKWELEHRHPSSTESSCSVTQNQINLARSGRKLGHLRGRMSVSQAHSPDLPEPCGKQLEQSTKVGTKGKASGPSKEKPTVGEKLAADAHSKNKPTVTEKPTAEVFVKIEPTVAEKPATEVLAKDKRKIKTKMANKNELPAVCNPKEGEVLKNWELPSRADKLSSVTHISKEGRLNILNKAQTGLNIPIKCFFCATHLPLKELIVHQDGCYKVSKARRIASGVCSHSDIKEEECTPTNSDSTKCFLEEGGKFASLPFAYGNQSCEEAFETCWYCGWEYPHAVMNDHTRKCAPIHGNCHPTGKHKKTQKLVEMRLKAYGTRKRRSHVFLKYQHNEQVKKSSAYH